MSTLQCRCGHVIHDSTYPKSTEGWIRRDQDHEKCDSAASHDLGAFLKAVQEGKREEWIEQYFSNFYPQNCSDVEVINDIFAHHWEAVDLSICECIHCGRLHVQRQSGVNSYASYMPDDGVYQGILHSSPPSTTPDD